MIESNAMKALTLTLALFAVPAAAADVLPAGSRERAAPVGYAAMCAADPAAFACTTPTTNNSLSVRADVLARRVRAQVADRIRYRSDRNEDWRTLTADVLAGERVRGDCDEYALTAADLLIRAGANPAHVRLVVVAPIAAFTTAEDIDLTATMHLVTVLDDPERGESYVIDSMQDAVWRSDQLRYLYVADMRLSEAGTWRVVNHV